MRKRWPHEHPDLRHQEELRHQEGGALLQGAAHQVPVHRPAREGDEQGGGLDALIDPKAKDQDTVALITYLAESQKFDKLLENQQILREPIVRNGKQATVGYEPDTWKTWE